MLLRSNVTCGSFRKLQEKQVYKHRIAGILLFVFLQCLPDVSGSVYLPADFAVPVTHPTWWEETRRALVCL